MDFLARRQSREEDMRIDAISDISVGLVLIRVRNATEGENDASKVPFQTS